jgi:cytochrome c
MRRAVTLACLGAVFGGSLIAAVGATAQAPPDSEFQKVTLNDHPGEPMDLAVLPDNRVLHTARTGELYLHDPRTGLNTIAAEFDVYEHDEEGLQSVAIDPNFERNNWVYIYYSPPLDTPVDDPSTPDVNEGDAPEFGTEEDWERFRGYIQLSRFKWRGDELDMDSEQQIIRVPVDRGICCHVGGQIDFDLDGNLILSTGDDTNPFESDGYTPIDERPDRNPAFDAQRTSANTNDLRGKILRITVGRGGDYTIPPGNLFPLGMAQTRPEIYAMGFRNPFRFSVDRDTGYIYVGDYSPDNEEPDPQRGPSGQGKWTIITEPGNYGWPYCATAELPYVDGEFVAGPDPEGPPGFISSGEEFDCANPVNESPNNTGLEELPPVVQPDVWYSYGPSAEFPELGEGGIGPMGGPALDLDGRGGTRGYAWPAYYEDVPLFYEWTRDYIKEFRLNGAGTDVRRIRPVLPSFIFDNPMAMEFGPDGALYVLEYGDGFFLETPEAQLARIDYVGGGNRSPVPRISAEPTNGPTPLTVDFSSAGTGDPDGDRLRFRWDFDADGRVDSRRQNPADFTYEQAGVYNATLLVIDRRGKRASASVEIVVGNETPVVELVQPVEGQPFQFGDTVTFEVQVTDDQPVDCANVEVNYVLGHDQHGHGISTARGCTGSIQTILAPGHGGEDNLRAVFVAEYTDPGIDGDGQLTDSDQVVLVPNP